jgi:hypothetical protein
MLALTLSSKYAVWDIGTGVATGMAPGSVAGAYPASTISTVSKKKKISLIVSQIVISPPCQAHPLERNSKYHHILPFFFPNRPILCWGIVSVFTYDVCLFVKKAWLV